MRWIVAATLFALALAAGARLGNGIRAAQAPDFRGPALRVPIAWQMPEVELAGCCIHDVTDVEGPRAERIADWNEQIERALPWARYAHQTSRVHFDPAAVTAVLLSEPAERCTVRAIDAFDTPAGIDTGWDFLVRRGRVQFHYAVTEMEGDVLHGTLRARRTIRHGRRGVEAVRLLRPVYQRPRPEEARLSPLAYESALRRYAADIVRAQHPGELRYPMDPPMSQWGQVLKASEGRLLMAERQESGPTIVVLDQGSDDGVIVGAELRVSRGSKFVGSATVTRVYQDKAAALFDDVHTGDGAPPRAGDRWSFE